MNIDVVTLFPEMVQGFFSNSIMRRAVENGIITYNMIDFRNFATDKHHTCDDSPYGGGAGMVLKPEPLCKALESIKAKEKRVIYASPSGKRLTQALSKELSEEENLVFICGHYEGIDQRVIDLYVDDEISIGDYVISSGEISSLVIIDSVYRLIDGVISSESLEEESFSDGLLEYPQYTRPNVFNGLEVPEVLLNGNHKAIKQWRLEKRLEKTLSFRPELLEQKSLDLQSRKTFNELRNRAKRT
ncbi:MAG: tRNA (guanosine(37)-N1)-methyltransferase TrmD [Sphaerochaetaceae bacterium]|nr:tRNA (guanosine(37)-N1)-methyltransferase TrmD [Sphaerochaetaceae bacterium]MDC7238197.1 tRNA (guanosine(37)-N1)-methyltransferase TrmD [Sphaerochaetaceae bacterium]MDC7244141.1 tRNA (guanosine(37)-N1)-methyltransferase TrmD [Sphaerochaetaceae bacterium]MDC7249993.1 tRNA (guanosine(37)-N1)-methyltransferase TrmD [Sphaerochaetaceae bacterium]